MYYVSWVPLSISLKEFWLWLNFVQVSWNYLKKLTSYLQNVNVLKVLSGWVTWRSVLVEYVPTFSPGLNFLGAHCYITRKRTAAVAVMPVVVKLLLLGEGIVGKVLKRKRTDPDRQTDFGNTRLMECRRPAFCVCARMCVCVCGVG